MIITDLDNTLLRNNKSISEYTLSVLNKCRQKGIIIAFATARSVQASSRFLTQFRPDVFIGYGGSLVLAGEKIIGHFDIPPEISGQLIKDSMAAPEVSSIFAINESVALTNNLDDMPDTDFTHYEYSDFSEKYNYRYLKISLVSSSQTVVEKIAAKYPMCDMLRYTGENLYRFANREAGKWNAVKIAAAHYNISTDTMVAFGDDVNDLEMVANCGISVAVENAVRAVKAAAKQICGSNDNDGVAHWLEKNVLNQDT